MLTFCWKFSWTVIYQKTSSGIHIYFEENRWVMMLQITKWTFKYSHENYWKVWTIMHHEIKAIKDTKTTTWQTCSIFKIHHSTCGDFDSCTRQMPLLLFIFKIYFLLLVTIAFILVAHQPEIFIRWFFIQLNLWFLKFNVCCIRTW